LELASRVPLEVLSCDSRKVYRGADIGAAKPTAAQRERVPFHLLDLVGPAESFSVQRYAAAARAALSQVLARGRLPVFEGGTGLYLEALIRGYDFHRAPPVEQLRGLIRRAWQSRRGEFVHSIKRLFPEAAAQVDLHNLPRVVRLIEKQVAHAPEQELEQLLGQLGLASAAAAVAGARAESEAASGGCAPIPVKGYLLEVASRVLAERIAARTEAMLAQGLISEVESLLASGVPPGAQVFSGIGYREVLQYLEGAVSRDRLPELISLHTRQFARRQNIWNRSRFSAFTRLPFTTGEERVAALDRLGSELGGLLAG